jgi:hypothetical protein
MSDGFHFICDPDGQTALIQIEVTAAFEVSKLRANPQLLQGLIEEPGGLIQVKRIGRSHGEMNVVLQPGTERFGMAADHFGDIVLLPGAATTGLMTPVSRSKSCCGLPSSPRGLNTHSNEATCPP